MALVANNPPRNSAFLQRLLWGYLTPLFVILLTIALVSVLPTVTAALKPPPAGHLLPTSSTGTAPAEVIAIIAIMLTASAPFRRPPTTNGRHTR